MGHIVDLTRNLDANTPVIPGFPPVRIDAIQRIPADLPVRTVGAMNVSGFSMIIHTCTHMDAPFHFYAAGKTIDQIPLERCMGRAVRIDLHHKGARAEITAGDLAPYAEGLRRTRKVVIRTGWGDHWGKDDFFADHPAITGDAAAFLVDCGVELVGVDMHSVDREPYPAHFTLLGNGVLIVENLANLDQIDADEFTLVALPLKLTGLDGSPVRVAAVLD